MVRELTPSHPFTRTCTAIGAVNQSNFRAWFPIPVFTTIQSGTFHPDFIFELVNFNDKFSKIHSNYNYRNLPKGQISL